tara:strand:- start:507 stop:734 length:228 start_codon:yes stop_codon:yes gene_type:complete
MYDPVVLNILEKNIKDLQQQLGNAHKRLKVVNDENYKLKREIELLKDNGRKIINDKGSAWIGDAEMPDAGHLKDE